jgi:hypothetical protein
MLWDRRTRGHLPPNPPNTHLEPRNTIIWQVLQPSGADLQTYLIVENMRYIQSEQLHSHYAFISACCKKRSELANTCPTPGRLCKPLSLVYDTLANWPTT